MIGALLGLLLAALDQTIVSTAGPFIQKDLAIEAGIYVWITTAYLVASTVLVPVYGKLSDLYGRRRILLVAIGIFLGGSLACGLSQSAAQLIAFRAVQGIGSAGLFTSAFAVVADLFPPAERGKWQGMFGAAWGVSSVIGPLLGGVLTQHLSWHWTFFVNLPIGAVAVGLIVSRMPALRREHAVRPKLDIAGALALAFATVPVLLALSLGHAEGTSTNGWPWLSWQILSLFGTSVAATIAFIVIEQRASSPILDLKLFGLRPFAIGSLATFVVGSAFLGAIVFLPLFMVNVVGLSATSSGLTTTPLTFGIVAANIMSGQLVSRLGAYKGLLVGSLVVLVASFAMLALTLSTGETQGSMSLKMVMLGIGLGPSIPLFTLAIQTAVPMQQIGVATAAATFFRQMGTTIGLAILGTIFATSFAGSLKREMPPASEMPPQMRAMMERGGDKGGGEAASRVAFDAGEARAKADANIDTSPMPQAGKQAAKQRAHEAIGRVDHAFKQAFTSSLVNVFWISLAIALLGLVITVLMPAVPLRSRGGGSGPPPPAVD